MAETTIPTFRCGNRECRIEFSVLLLAPSVTASGREREGQTDTIQYCPRCSHEALGIRSLTIVVVDKPPSNGPIEITKSRKIMEAAP